MTVEELIEKLQQFPPNTLVVTTGYEDGYTDIGQLHMVSILMHANKNIWYYGTHSHAEPDDLEAVKAVLIPREDLT